MIGAWRLDKHPAQKAGYHDIPYRTLLPQNCDNLLVAGRCHSATSEALASSRVTATAMGMGQAAGIASALAVKDNATPRDIAITALQDRILKSGGILEAPKSDIQVGNPKW